MTLYCVPSKTIWILWGVRVVLELMDVLPVDLSIATLFTPAMRLTRLVISFTHASQVIPEIVRFKVCIYKFEIRISKFETKSKIQITK